MNKLDTTNGQEWYAIDKDEVEIFQNHRGMKSHDNLLWDVIADDKIDANFCTGLALKYKDYDWQVVYFPEEYKTRTETANLLDFVTVDFIENFKRDMYYADCKKFSEKFTLVSHAGSIYDHIDWQNDSDTFYIRDYSCDFEDLKTIPFSARIIDKTIFIEDYFTRNWYCGPLLNDPIGTHIPSSPYKQLLDFFVYNRKPTIQDIKNHIKSELSDYNFIVKKYEKNISVIAIVTACKKLDGEYKTFSEKLLKEYKESSDYDPNSSFDEDVFMWNQSLEFREDIGSKLMELWDLLAHIIYFKYFDEIYEHGFSRSPKTLFFEHSSLLNMTINKDLLHQNSRSRGYNGKEANGHLDKICKKLIVGPDWYYKDFFLDDMDDGFDDGWSYSNSYEESSDDEKDTFFRI